MGLVLCVYCDFLRKNLLGFAWCVFLHICIYFVVELIRLSGVLIDFFDLTLASGDAN